ncbi:hypothetical protein BDF21DRAFT_376338 [Thamnidium elegans]|uniref:Receptor L-domain domain-containing protein n=1 Tax=Thamnidium elegans TaxID=101142 RepID=A0A8H7VR76_9FUNG|nr:hypothetical protein INT48_003581 [Thamnidium elegans]KAI8091566.1 hypothetical protein BDF21DRAFT_376338 [Thamnidium elegans]
MSLVPIFFIFLFSGVLAASRECTGPVQIGSSQELDTIRSCQVFDGSITIQNMTSSEDLLNLSQLQQVHGDLIINGNADVSQIVLASLQQVDGSLKFQNNRQLKRLDLTQLTAVQSLEISVQPSLDTIQFPSGLSQIETFTVTDTIASKIEGLAAGKMKDIKIANNIYLKDINLNHLQQVGGVISISANSPNLSLDISSISSIYQGDFRNLARLIGLNQVRQVTGDVSFIGNTFLSLSLPNITQIAGTLTVSDNKQLQNLSVPQLQALGGALSVANNTQLTHIEVPKLQQVDGTVDITGNFEKVDLPSLVDVRGGLNVQTSSSNFSCEDVNKLKGGVTKGHEFTCKSNVSNPKSGVSLNNGTDTNHDATDSGADNIQVTWIPLISIIISLLIK